MTRAYSATELKGQSKERAAASPIHPHSIQLKNHFLHSSANPSPASEPLNTEEIPTGRISYSCFQAPFRLAFINCQYSHDNFAAGNSES